MLPQEPSSDEDEKAARNKLGGSSTSDSGPHFQQAASLKDKSTAGEPQHQLKSTISPIRILPEPPIISASLPLPPKIGSIILPTARPIPTVESRISAPFEDLSDTAIRDSFIEPSIEEKKEAKRADDKVRDRLAQIAREKLGILSKEKQVQIERKKRAMAFLNNIKGKTFGTSTRVKYLITNALQSIYRAINRRYIAINQFISFQSDSNQFRLEFQDCNIQIYQ